MERRETNMPIPSGAHFEHVNVEPASDLANSTDLHSLIRILNEQNESNSKIRYLKAISTFIPKTSIDTVDRDVFQYILPTMKTVFKEIFNDNLVLINGNNTNESNLNKLRKQLKECEDLIDVVDVTLKCIMENKIVDLTLIGNVPQNVASMLLITFQHCKNCNSLCANYCEDVHEIFSLFKKTQNTHLQFLKILESNVDISFFCEFEVIVLKEDILCSISDILYDMNQKSMISNWKGYVTIVQKYINELKYEYDVVVPLKIISAQIAQKLKSIVDLEMKDVKIIKYFLKITNCLVSLFVKLSESFWSNLHKNYNYIVYFISIIYSYKNLYSQYNEYLDLLKIIDSLLDKLLIENNFFNFLPTLDERSDVLNHVPLGFIFFCVNIFQKLSTTCIIEGLQHKLHLPKLLDVIFIAVDQCFVEFLCELKNNTLREDNSVIYEDLLINVASFCLLCNHSYEAIEVLLLKNVLSGSVWKATFAIDVWDLLLRHCPPKLCYQALCNMIEKCQVLSSMRYTMRIEMLFLQNLLSRFFFMLPDNAKIEVIEKYSRREKQVLSKLVSFRKLPLSQRHIVESSICEMFEKIELLENGQLNISEFNILCNNMEMMSTIAFTDLDISVKNVTHLVTNLWNFELSIVELKCNHILKMFLICLCKITNNLILHFDNSQLLCILLQLKQLVQNEQTIMLLALNCLQLLNKLSNKSIEYSQEYGSILSTISDIFTILLKHKNILIKQNGIDTFYNFAKITHHNEIVQNVQNSCCIEMQKNYTNFDQVVLRNYCQSLRHNMHKHQCVTWGAERVAPIQKKFKTDTGDINAAVQRLKSDAHFLSKIDSSCLSQEHLRDIATAINDLQKL